MATKRNWKEYCSEDGSQRELVIVSRIAAFASSYLREIDAHEQNALKELDAAMNAYETAIKTGLQAFREKLSAEIAENAERGRRALGNSVTFCPQSAPSSKQVVVTNLERFARTFARSLECTAYVSRGTTVLDLPDEVLKGVMLWLDAKSLGAAWRACRAFRRAAGSVALCVRPSLPTAVISTRPVFTSRVNLATTRSRAIRCGNHQLIFYFQLSSECTISAYVAPNTVPPTTSWRICFVLTQVLHDNTAKLLSRIGVIHTALQLQSAPRIARMPIPPSTDAPPNQNLVLNISLSQI